MCGEAVFLCQGVVRNFAGVQILGVVVVAESAKGREFCVMTASSLVGRGLGLQMFTTGGGISENIEWQVFIHPVTLD